MKAKRKKRSLFLISVQNLYLHPKFKVKIIEDLVTNESFNTSDKFQIINRNS